MAGTNPTIPPGAFAVTVSNVSPISAQLNWTASVDPEGATVCYSVILGTDTVVRNQTATQHTFYSLAANGNYSGKVIAYDPAGHMAENSFQFSTNDYLPPSDFTVSQTTGSSMNNISWTAATVSDGGQVSYDVYLNNQLVAASLTQLNYQFKPLTELTSYTGKVVAKSSHGKSTEKSFVFTTTANPAPTAPVLSIVDYGFAYIRFSFTAAVDPEGETVSYRVLLNDQDVTSQVTGTVAPSSSLALKYLNFSTNYKLEIKAVDAAGKQSTSNAQQLTTHNNAISTITNIQNSVSGGNLTITFDKVSTADNGFISLVLEDIPQNTVPIQTTKNGTMVSVTYPLSVLPLNKTSRIGVKVDWGLNERQSPSINTLYSNFNFTSTTATLDKAWFNASQQYTITFVNGMISEDPNWDFGEVFFDNVKMSTLAAIVGTQPNYAYVAGTVGSGTFAYLATKTPDL